MNALDLRKEIVSKGIAKMLEEAKVPHHLHIQVVKALHGALEKHKNDLAEYDKRFAQHQDKAEKLHANVLKEFQRLSSTDFTGAPGMDGRSIKGDKGEQGAPGIAPSVEQVVQQLLPYVLNHIPEPKQGEAGAPGKDANEEKILENLIARLQKGDVLHISHVRGASGFIKDGVKYRYEELMHGAGSSTGGGITFATPTGTVDSVNTSFGVTAQPTLVIADGITYFENAGYTYAALAITMSIAPSQYIRYAV